MSIEKMNKMICSIDKIIENYEWEKQQLLKKLIMKNKEVFKEIESRKDYNDFVIANLEKEVNYCKDLRDKINNIDNFLADLKYIKMSNK